MLPGQSGSTLGQGLKPCPSKSRPRPPIFPPEKIPARHQVIHTPFHPPRASRKIPRQRKQNPARKGHETHPVGCPSRSRSLPPLPRGQMPRPRAEIPKIQKPEIPRICLPPLAVTPAAFAADRASRFRRLSGKARQASPAFDPKSRTLTPDAPLSGCRFAVIIQSARYKHAKSLLQTSLAWRCPLTPGKRPNQAKSLVLAAIRCRRQSQGSNHG
jgi:hypothetical protein